MIGAVFSAQVAGHMIDARVSVLGNDLLIHLTGGERPHIGSVILCEPRQSLTGTGRSATSSVLNVPGHYDEIPGRRLAESVAAGSNRRVCCVCGIHYECAGPEVICAVQTACESLSTDILRHLAAEPA